MRRFRPSPALVLACLALLLAAGGVSYATVKATGSAVNIVDPATGAQIAKVDTTGRLQVLATVGNTVTSRSTTPATPFFGHAYMSQSSTNTLISANTATVALTRLVLANYFDQTNGATVDIRLSEMSGTSTVCDGSTGSRSLGTYEVPVGQTFADVMGTPVVLKPLVNGDVWCLQAFVAIQGGPGSYFLPEASFSGYVAAGTLPPGAVSVAVPTTGDGGPARSTG